MIGGTMKTTSRFALAAAAGLFVGAMAFTPAKAADLGGDCCADLEERVAELEATTVRKGNRVVSVQLYGQVNRALMFWDDGVDSDVYEVDGDGSGTRIGVRGSGALMSGVEAGYRLEWELQTNDSSDVSQFNHEGDGVKDGIALRQANVYLDGSFGRVTLGQQSSALDGVAQVNLGGTFAVPDSTSVGGFLIRDDNENVTPGFTWGDVIFDGDGGRNNGIRYDSPSLAGFILSAFWGEDDLAQVALRFSKEWNSVRVAAAVGYGLSDPDLKTEGPGAGTGLEGSDDELEWVVGSVSAMHVPTGIFAMFSAHDSELDYEAAGTDDLERSHWYVQAGVNKNWTGMGSTRIFGEYGEHETEGAVAISDGVFDPSFLTGDAEATVIGGGIEQTFDAAATDVYLHVRNYELDGDTPDEYVEQEYEGDAEDLTTVMGGMRVKF
ncbi:porin-like protein [Dichotomicrobium thermohalophilum]|uniref:Porin-like protein n=2 Tax=Dichotomicrobium thermohalophilum TaxID=933063 RepID=A0A397PD69_9HYPH|nr:porin-like protein [Dichotomicrobium thermohalophilum]